ncbi:MAG: response regulator [Gammaproteobacteria bacterium]|nr:response regulator [Gammaproteobacteria bacterium]QOJ32938.1 MAG: response regulator [Gammaproteobacteria bacterium]
MKRATLLLVDDEPNVTLALKRALRQEPYEILTADGAEKALQLLAANPVDVVVSDERMPGMPGSVFLAKVREAYPETVRIILSGQASLEDAIRAINEGGIYRFCLKPVNAADLAVTIRQAIQHKQLVEQSRRLLREYQKRTAQLDEYQRKHPGLFQLEMDDDGAIVLDEEDDSDVDTLLSQMEAALSKGS